MAKVTMHDRILSLLKAETSKDHPLTQPMITQLLRFPSKAGSRALVLNELAERNPFVCKRPIEASERKPEHGRAEFFWWYDEPLQKATVPSAHSHYFKDVRELKTIDVYRVLQLFNVTDPCLQHAVKKLLVAGGRGGGKDISKDIQESIDSLERWKQMREEEKRP